MDGAGGSSHSMPGEGKGTVQNPRNAESVAWTVSKDVGARRSASERGGVRRSTVRRDAVGVKRTATVVHGRHRAEDVTVLWNMTRA